MGLARKSEGEIVCGRRQRRKLGTLTSPCSPQWASGLAQQLDPRRMGHSFPGERLSEEVKEGKLKRGHIKVD